MAASRIDSLLADASTLWPRSGGPPESPLREVFALQLVLLSVTRETALQTGATTVPAARPAPSAAPARAASDAAASTLAPGLQILETGYRHLQPDFLTAAEARRLRATAALGMVQAFRRGSQTVLSLVPDLEARLRASGDAEGFALLSDLLERVRRQCEEDRRQPGEPLLPCGALLIRLEPPGAADAALPSWDLAARQRYSEPHVDKENVRAYDASALVYLSNHGEHFGGGAFAFHDAAADVKLAPREGTLLTFSSGAENLHSVAPVEWGCRVALACWFTTDPRCATAALVAAPPAPPPAAWSLLDGESALLSAAITTLASNDGARARLLAAHARGTPLLRELAEMGDEGAGGPPPAAWREAIGTAAAEPGVVDGAPPPLVKALREQLEVRIATLERLEGRGGEGVAEAFAVFD